MQAAGFVPHSPAEGAARNEQRQDDHRSDRERINTQTSERRGRCCFAPNTKSLNDCQGLPRSSISVSEQIEPRPDLWSSFRLGLPKRRVQAGFSSGRSELASPSLRLPQAPVWRSGGETLRQDRAQRRTRWSAKRGIDVRPPPSSASLARGGVTEGRNRNADSVRGAHKAGS